MRIEGPPRNANGFTLLETMIAMAIMLIAFSAILMVESSSINTSLKAKRLNVVSMLAKTKLLETEMEIEGKSFGEIRKEAEETFKDPYQDYRWKRVIKEVKFPNITATASDEQSTNAGESGAGGLQEKMGKLVTNFLSKALREVTVTIFWKSGTGEQSYSISTYWVNLNHEFQLSE